MLDTLGNDSITINTKESTPTLEKKIKEIDSDNGYFNIEAKTYEIMTVGIAK